MNFYINNPTPNSRGVREQRNVVSQLKKNNTYSLTENNERRISTAIDELSQHSGEANTRFLIDVANELKYSTNINLNKKGKIDWQKKLHQAAESSYEKSDDVTKQKLAKSMDKMLETKPLNGTEKYILKTRERILSKLDMDQLKDEKNSNIKNVQRNLDYFIASSETSTEQKAEILKKLNFMLSPKYKINPQLKNQKTKVVAEIINDIVVDTPESKVPNTKAINQKHHGMCAAISISRKLMSYEDKSKYIDILMSELDATPHIMIFDKTSIGKNKRIPVEKAYVDFEEAQNKGYRIIDASTTQWMNIADMYGASNKSKYIYTPFDSLNFDAMTDKHQMTLIPDDRYKYKHANYQALLNSQESITTAQKMENRNRLSKHNSLDKEAKSIEYMAKLNAAMVNELKTILPDQSSKELREFSQDLLQLRQSSSNNIDKKDKSIKKFIYIPNEETQIKNKKVADYIKFKYPNVNSEELDKKSGAIREFIDETLTKKKEIQPTHSQASNIHKARKLYEAAANYTYQKRTALKDSDYLTSKMLQYNIPDEETIISETLDKISKNPESDTAKIFKSRINGGDQKVEQIKNAFEKSKTVVLDSVYATLGLGDRRLVLQNEIASKIELISQNKYPQAETTKLANSLGVKNDKKQILKALESHHQKLENPKSTEQDYTNAFNKLGHKSQLEYSINIYMQSAEKLQGNDESAQLYRQYFNAINGLPENAPITQTVDRINQIGDSINSFNDFATNIASALQIETESGKVLHSVTPIHLVEKAMQRNGEIYSNNELQPLKDRFDKIDKIRSQDEFSSRQGAIKDQSLYKLSDNEQRTINKIRKNLNKMASETNKELESVFREIKEPLEEHVRKIGVDTGHYRNHQINGGLNSGQELKIIEHLTDRNYKISENIPKAIEKIKNSPHSGISSSSVFHDKIGMHAQYIEEVTPSPKNGKDILYHDNSWGASELENTWVDSEGLIRTDYSDRRGGELGYVTNPKYLNGNYVENIIYKTGKTSSGEKFELMSDIVLPGIDKKAKSIAASIREHVFNPTGDKIKDFDKLLSQMTVQEIEAGIKRNELAANGYRGQMKTLNEKVFGKYGKKGIETVDDYNKLPNNDIVKLTFEKAALSSSFPQGVDDRDIALAESIEKLEKLKEKMNKIARSYFDYAFGKEETIKQAYYGNDKNNHSNQIVKTALEKNNINIEDEKVQKIVAKSILKNDEKFDGSVKNTINKIIDNVSTNLDTELGQSTNLDKAKQEISKNLRTDLENALYINLDDVNNESTKFSGIKRYIDRKYKPETDEEFVTQYRKMQDMTKEEFSNTTKDVLPTELGIAKTSGYEILKRYKASNSTAENEIRNIIYQKELYNDTNLAKTKPAYKYHKLYKQEQGAIYKEKRTFDSFYRTMTFNLQNLELESMFNAVKESTRKKYGALPAYPKMEILTTDALKKEQDLFDSSIFSSLQEIETNRTILRGYRLTDKLTEKINKLDDNKKPASKEIDKIKAFAEEFIAENYGDSTIHKSLESAQSILDLADDAKGIEYKNAIKGLKTEFDGYRALNPPEKIKNSITNNIKTIKQLGQYFIVGDIQPKKAPIVADAFNKYMNKALTSNSHYIDSKIDIMSNRIDSYSLGKKGFKTVKNNYMDTLESDLYTITALNNQFTMQASTLEDANAQKELFEVINNYKSEIIEKIAKDSESFINGNIKKEHQTSVRANVKDLIKFANKPNASSKQIEQELAQAREEFYDSVSKHHILREPQELLKSYMKLMAKDATPESESMKKLFEHKKKIQKQYLEGANSAASLVDLQDTLMTVDNGANPGLIVEKLFAYDSGLVNSKTKQPLQMSDPISIDYMVKQMILGENDETAIMFINKLGFAKKYIDAQNTLINFDSANKIVDSIVNIVGKTQIQQNIVNDTLKPILSAEAGKNTTFLKDLDSAKKQIKEKSENLSDKTHIKRYLAAINNAKKLIKQNPDIPKETILTQALSYSNEQTQNILNQQIGILQEHLNVVHNTHRFINKLDVPDYSDAVKSREIFNEKYNKFVEYNNQSLINLSNSNSSVSCKIQES